MRLHKQRRDPESKPHKEWTVGAASAMSGVFRSVGHKTMWFRCCPFEAYPLNSYSVCKCFIFPFFYPVFPRHLSNSGLSRKIQLKHPFLWKPFLLSTKLDTSCPSSLNLSISWLLSHCHHVSTCQFPTGER